MEIDREILVLHVRKGYEDRERHINRMMAEKGLRFKYMLDGDIADITPETLDRYFTGDTMHKAGPQASCALKHIYACEHIVRNNLKGALVLEDDMVIYDNFKEIFNKCMAEIDTRQLKDPVISFDDSILKFIPRSRRRKGIYLYPGNRDRYTGCLYYSNGAARLILERIKDSRCGLPIDRYHAALITEGLLQYYWCQPCIATQGTHNGLFESSISAKSAKRQRYRANVWKIKLMYKKLVYFLR